MEKFYNFFTIEPGVGEDELSIRLTAIEEYYKSAGFTFSRKNCMLAHTTFEGIRKYDFTYWRQYFDVIKEAGATMLAKYPDLEFENIWEDVRFWVNAAIRFKDKTKNITDLKRDTRLDIEERLRRVDIVIITFV